MTRGRRSGVEDLWHRTIRDEHGEAKTVRSKRHGVGKRWRARYVADDGCEHSKAFDRKADATRWVSSQNATVVAGTHVPPRDAQITLEQWCDRWIEGYKRHRKLTVRQARTHIKQIVAEFGDMPLSAVRPSLVKEWVAKLRRDGVEASYLYALHSRLSQIMGDAVHDGVLGRNPCSRRTSPPMGKPKMYVASVDQIWALHDAMPERLKAAVLLGAFAGLRVAEVSGLRVEDVDFLRATVHPQQQWDGQPLKTPGSDAVIPIPRDLVMELSASLQQFPGSTFVTNEWGKPAGPWIIQRAIRDVKDDIDGLPDEFTFHDLRHFYASYLIAAGKDIKTVQSLMRHASARTTLDTYSHMFPTNDDSTRSALSAAFQQRNVKGDKAK